MEECLRSQFVTLKVAQGQHLKYMPYAFTEIGELFLIFWGDSTPFLHSHFLGVL